MQEVRASEVASVLWIALVWGTPVALAQGGGVFSGSSEPAVEGTEVLTPWLNLTVRGDVVVAGVGLRGAGQGMIQVSGIPAAGSVQRAVLYWATLGSDGTFESPTLDGVPVDGELIGTGADTCWFAQNNSSYRADVTALVGGNGSYLVQGLPSADPATNDSQGAALMVIFRDASMPQRAIIVNDGAVVLNDDDVPLQYTDLIADFDPVPNADAHLTHVVGDGQEIFLSGEIRYQGQNLSNHALVGTDGDYWDTLTYDVPSITATDPATTTLVGSLDCLLWVATVFSIEGQGAGIFFDGFGSAGLGAWSSSIGGS